MNSHICIFPGSFNPFHDGHKYVLSRALDYGFKRVIIVIAQNPNKSKNDFYANKKNIEHWIESNCLSAWVSLDVCENLLVDYMETKQIFTIIRGYRTLKDRLYENRLLKCYKSKLPQVECVLFKSNKLFKYVSSSIIESVKKRINT